MENFKSANNQEIENIELLNFKVHASLIYQLGESLIADEVTALSELLKNSYDADASFCQLYIEPNYNSEGEIGRITVTDNGCGMNPEIIIKGWLTLSDSPKQRMKARKETTPKFHRLPLGEKGLGRLSVQKLGKKMQMITKQKDSQYEYYVTIPWNKFQEDTTIDQIPISFAKKAVSDNKQSYTRIIITDLVNPTNWIQDSTIKDLEKMIGRIISPFRSQSSDFIVSAQVGDYEIDVSNSAFQDVLKTAKAVYSFSVSEKSIQLTCRYKINFFKTKTVKEYSEFNFQRDYFKEMFDKFLKEKSSSWIYHENGDIVYEVLFDFPIRNYPGLRCNSEAKLFYPGDFNGEIYYFTLSREYVNDLLKDHALTEAFNRSQYVEYVKNNKGIKVIRDNFIVQGYGDGNVDWLDLSSSGTTYGRWADINNSSVIGYVQLTGEKNYALRETTSREGFVDDDYYHNFYEILRNIVIKNINTTNYDLNVIFKNYLFKLFSNDDSEESPIDKIENTVNEAATVSATLNLRVQSFQKQIQTILDNAKNKESSSGLSDQISLFSMESTQSKEYESAIKEQNRVIIEIQSQLNSYLDKISNLQTDVRRIQSEIDLYQRKMSDVFALAGLGISVELFTHELFRNLKELSAAIAKLPQKSEEIIHVQMPMNALRKQLSYFYPGLKYVRLKKEKVSIINLIENHISFYQTEFESKKIYPIFELTESHEHGFTVELNVGMLNQVFDNLLSNSIYWLTYSRDKLKIIDRCSYHISLSGKGLVNVWDNGIGIAKEVEKDIFNPFVSCKENGRGLGLFICKNNLENNGGNIRLLRERNQFGNLFQFQIDLSHLTV